jgi:hypothetical protein
LNLHIQKKCPGIGKFNATAGSREPTGYEKETKIIQKKYNCAAISALIVRLLSGFS